MPGYAFCTAILICDFIFASFQLDEQPRLKKRVEAKAFAPLSILVSFWTYLQLWPFTDLGTLGNISMRSKKMQPPLQLLVFYKFYDYLCPLPKQC